MKHTFSDSGKDAPPTYTHQLMASSSPLPGIMSESIQVHYCLYLHVHILLFHSPTILYNNTFLWAIYFAILLFVASCHCCASDPVLPFKEDFMAIFLLYSFSLLFPLCPSSFSTLVWNVFVIQSHAHRNCLLDCFILSIFVSIQSNFQILSKETFCL